MSLVHLDGQLHRLIDLRHVHRIDASDKSGLAGCQVEKDLVAHRFDHFDFSFDLNNLNIAFFRYIYYTLTRHTGKNARIQSSCN